MKRRDEDIFEPKSRNRLLFLPAILLGLLVAMPWLLEMMETRWLPVGLTHFRELVDSLITALLGIWILTMIGREQEITRIHLDELEQLSLTDPLTGLGNRRAFERDLEVALSRAQRTDLALTLHNLAVLAYDLERSAAAATFCRQALAIFERNFVESHPTLVACRELAAALEVK